MPGLKSKLMSGAVVAVTVATGCSSTSAPDPQSDVGAGITLTASADVATVEFAADSWPVAALVPYDYRSLQHKEWLAYCVKAFGFETTLVSGPGQPPALFGDVTHAQMERWMEVLDICREEAEERGWVTPMNPTSDSQLRAEYDRLVSVNDCLTELGYGTDPMSWDTYRETREWNVYANTPRGSTLVVAPSAGTDLPADVRVQLSIQEACPLWGSSG